MSVSMQSLERLKASIGQRSLRAPRGAPLEGLIAEGVTVLGDWASSHSKEYEVTAQRRDADGPMVDRALEIVRKFIIERGLILFGGLAIDYALRIKGDRIYPDEQRPDFDFLSTKSVDDAYDLADILQKAGFEGVGAIRAIHVQTMKVRTNFVWVADIGYAPPEVFAKIPTFEYQGMRVVHPDYQRMDMHLAFCFPFNGPPREDVYHRWRKDLKRFNLFETHYPIAPAPVESKTRTVSGKLAVPIIGRGPSLRVALHGFAAYSILRSTLDEIASAFGMKLPKIKAPHLSLKFPDAQTAAVEMPVGETVVIASPWPEEAIADLSGVSKFSPYMDISPESYRAGDLVVLSTKGRLLAACLVRVGKDQAFVVTPQYLLLWLLFEAQRADSDASKNIYRTFYVHTLEILRTAEDMYAKIVDGASSEEERKAAMDSFALSPFAPTLSTIGDLNLDAAYIIKMAGNAQKLQDVPPAVLNLDPDVAKLLEGLPANYYPATSKQRPTFTYDTNFLFRRSGQKI